MAVTQLKSNVFLHKASHLYYTPWAQTSVTIGGVSQTLWMPTSNTYDIVDILADTISIEQGDPTTETVDWEFGDSPLMSTSTKGERTFAASCIDLSMDILEKVFGWARQTASGGGDAFVNEPSGSTDSYATIVVTFHGNTAPIIVLPMVNMNSKTTIGTLKTSTGQADLGGTAQVAYLEYSGASAETEMAVLKAISAADIEVAISTAASSGAVAIGQVTLAATTNEVSLT